MSLAIFSPLTFPELDLDAARVLTVALHEIRERNGTGPTSQLYALGATRRLLSSLARAYGCNETTTEALQALFAPLEETEKALRAEAKKEEKKKRKGKGGRRFEGATLDQRMAVKLAVEWLTELTPPMPIEDAITAVAECLPREYCTGKQSQRDIAKAWRDDYTRETRGTRGRKSGVRYKDVFERVKYVRNAQFEHSNWVIVGQTETGEQRYAVLPCGRTYLDASPTEVIAWMETQFYVG